MRQSNKVILHTVIFHRYVSVQAMYSCAYLACTVCCISRHTVLTKNSVLLCGHKMNRSWRVAVHKLLYFPRIFRNIRQLFVGTLRAFKHLPDWEYSSFRWMVLFTSISRWDLFWSRKLRQRNRTGFICRILIFKTLLDVKILHYIYRM